MRRSFFILLLLLLAVPTLTSAQDKEAQAKEAITTYTKILKSETAARNLVSQIVSYTDRAPWQLSANLALGQRMLVWGLPGKMVVPTLEACGDMIVALAGNEKGFAELVQIMIALRNSKNKSNYTHLSLLENSGVPVYKMLGEAMNKAPETINLYALQGKLDSKVAFETLLMSFESEYKGTAKRVPKAYWLK